MLKSYHFDVGDSNIGPIGYCARVFARNPEEALAVIRDLLPVEINNLQKELGHLPALDYLDVFFNWTTHPTLENLSEDEAEVELGEPKTQKILEYLNTLASRSQE